MVTLYRAAYQNEFRAKEYNGLSTESKPTLNVENGSYFVEIDTGDIYRFDAENEQWYVQPAQGGGECPVYPNYEEGEF